MAQSEHWYSNPTQVFWCCDALTRGRTISHKTEIREANGWRLGAIIHRLKTAYGWPILSERLARRTSRITGWPPAPIRPGCAFRPALRHWLTG